MDATVGKRVYFLYPNSVIQSEMVVALIQDEYEVYLIKDHRKAVTLFHRYPESVLFINLDEGQTEPAWEQYVRDLQNDDDLQSLQIGILSYNTDADLAQKYLMELMVSGGFIKLSLGLKESTLLVRRVLEVNEARGRRRFLRVKAGDKNSTLNVRHGDNNLTGTVMDLSSVGMACTFSPDPSWVHHTEVESIQLKLKGILCLVSGVIMGTRKEGDDLVYVILFNKKTNPEAKSKIHDFMAWSLQHQVESELEEIP